MKTNWNEQFKLRIANTKEDPKHLIVKALLIYHIQKKYGKNYQRVYPEFKVPNTNKVCDVYHENFKTKEVYCYEVQKQVDTEWLEKTKRQYEKASVYGMKSVDWVLVKLGDLSDDLKKLNKQVAMLVN